MLRIILASTLPLFLLGGCSTLQAMGGGHDAHHPKMAPAMQGASAPVPDAKAGSGMMANSSMAANPDMMKNCPMMKDGVMTQGGMPMSGGVMPGMSGKGSMTGSGDAMQKCPMMDGKATPPAPH